MNHLKKNIVRCKLQKNKNDRLFNGAVMVEGSFGYKSGFVVGSFGYGEGREGVTVVGTAEVGFVSFFGCCSFGTETTLPLFPIREMRCVSR